ncbi:MAG: phosphotransferase [Myxococcota bacterium]
MASAKIGHVAGLSCWTGVVEPIPLAGGLTNENFAVVDRGEKFFVRLGRDIPIHGVMRFNELAASRAAHAAGLAPEVIHTGDGALVLRFIEGETLTAADVRRPENLQRIVDLIRRCHTEIPKHFRGPALVFWVFQILRDYAATLREGASSQSAALPRLCQIATTLERSVGPIDLVFGHNDLLAANWIDDGDRLWLIDWEYAGFNSPVFDLANLASGSSLSTAQQNALLASYFGRVPEKQLRRSYSAMKCASLLRESMWSMVSELHSDIDFDFASYTAENLERFEREWESHQREFPR